MRDPDYDGAEAFDDMKAHAKTHGEWRGVMSATTEKYYEAGYEAGTSAAQQTSDRPETRDDFGRVADKIRAALADELEDASPAYLTGFNNGMHDVWFEWLKEDPPERVTAPETPTPS